MLSFLTAILCIKAYPVFLLSLLGLEHRFPSAVYYRCCSNALCAEKNLNFLSVVGFHALSGCHFITCFNRHIPACKESAGASPPSYLPIPGVYASYLLMRLVWSVDLLCSLAAVLTHSRLHQPASTPPPFANSWFVFKDIGCWSSAIMHNLILKFRNQ